jgi:hypothetical protein
MKMYLVGQNGSLCAKSLLPLVPDRGGNSHPNRFLFLRRSRVNVHVTLASTVAPISGLAKTELRIRRLSRHARASIAAEIACRESAWQLWADILATQIPNWDTYFTHRAIVNTSH